MSDKETIASLERELIGTQEMLAFVLKAVGEPVFVSKQSITRGLGDHAQIQVDDDIERDGFVFTLTEAE
jgi:hypothetical protein